MAAFEDTYGPAVRRLLRAEPDGARPAVSGVAARFRAEGLTRHRPVDLGRLLGLDRAPEVKTLRRKLAELTGRGQDDDLRAALARTQVAGRPELLGGLHAARRRSAGIPRRPGHQQRATEAIAGRRTPARVRGSAS